uniref:Uncharacterized protein n=1 Tax=Cacopsylla melanoneura TaxID=428564 RepID=A0A8D9FKG8_9HEMI
MVFLCGGVELLHNLYTHSFSPFSLVSLALFSTSPPCSELFSLCNSRPFFHFSVTLILFLITSCFLGFISSTVLERIRTYCTVPSAEYNKIGFIRKGKNLPGDEPFMQHSAGMVA